MLLAIDIMTLILAAISPLVDTVTMFFTFSPFSIIRISILPLVTQSAIKMIVFEFSSVDIPQLVECTLPIFLIVQELTNISGPVWISCFPVAIGNIILPLAFEPESFFANIHSIAICNIILKISIIVAAISFDKSAFAFTSSIDESSLKKIVIMKIQFAIPMWFFIKSLTNISGIQGFYKELFFGYHQIPHPGSLSRREIPKRIFDKLAINTMVLIACNFMQSGLNHRLGHEHRFAHIESINLQASIHELIPSANFRHGHFIQIRKLLLW